jgi:hypothetical protein
MYNNPVLTNLFFILQESGLQEELNGGASVRTGESRQVHTRLVFATLFTKFTKVTYFRKRPFWFWVLLFLVTGFFPCAKFEMSSEHPCSIWIQFVTFLINYTTFYLTPKSVCGFIGRMDYLTHWISRHLKNLSTVFTRKHQQNMP